jgi:predicted nuclease of restriction endonuclease-like (RecB) superfamily
MLKKHYISWLKELKQNIEQQKLQTVLQVNTNLLLLYWYIGKQINNKIEIEGWGTKVIEQLSIDLQKAFSDEQGFSRRNLFYMKKFAEAYPDLLIVQPPAALLGGAKNNNKNIITQPVVAQFNNQKLFPSNPLLLSISWSHHIAIIEKCTNNEERNWYVKKVVNEGWSKTVLKYHLDTDAYNRQHKKSLANNFNKALPKLQSELANEIFILPQKHSFININVSK